MKYFAYGSNMFTRRLQKRVPSAQAVAVAVLAGYRLCFHKKSNDGSGKCNALRTDNAQDAVLGVVFEMDPSEKARLDDAEGLGKGYRERAIEVVGPQGQMTAFIYVAEANAIDASVKPYTWYKQFVVYGAHQHSLPDAYIQQIEMVDAVTDPDRERERRNFALLAET